MPQSKDRSQADKSPVGPTRTFFLQVRKSAIELKFSLTCPPVISPLAAMYIALLFLASTALSAPNLNLNLTPRQSTQKVTVDLTKRYQTIDGFGFSGAFQRANLIVNLKDPKQSEVLNLLFNTTTGAGFSIVRNGIGSSKTSQNDWMNTILPNCPATPSVGSLSDTN